MSACFYGFLLKFIIADLVYVHIPHRTWNKQSHKGQTGAENVAKSVTCSSFLDKRGLVSTSGFLVSLMLCLILTNKVLAFIGQIQMITRLKLVKT